MTWSRTSSNRLRRKPSSFTCRSVKRASMILASCSASLRSKAVTRATIRVMRSLLIKSNGRKKTREGSGRRTILVRDARMDMAAKLSGNYTLADVFKQLFHQARVAAAAAAVIRSASSYKGAPRPSPHKPPPPLETCWIHDVSGRQIPKLFPAEEFPFPYRNWPLAW
jgi:hypothetical protein